MRHLVSVVAACLLLCSGTASPALAQCADVDGDGFFREPGCGTLEDCNDAAPASFPGAFEVCDGYDNDCDGLIDDDPACITSCPAPREISGGAVIVTDGEADAHELSIVWSGTEYGVSWCDDRTGTKNMYFARLDVAGVKIGDDTELGPAICPSGLTYQSTRSLSSLVWTGTEYALAYRSADGTVVLQRIDAAGSALGAPSAIASNGRLPVVAWTGSEFGVISATGGWDLVFKKMDATGQEVPGSELVFSAEPPDFLVSLYGMDLVWSGDGYGLTYAYHYFQDGYDWDGAYFRRLDRDGAPIGTPEHLLVGPSEFLTTTVEWTGYEYSAMHFTGYAPSVKFSRFSAAGTPIVSGMDVLVGTDQVVHATFVWNGSEYGLAFNDIEGGPFNDYFNRMDPLGGALSQSFVVAPDRRNYGSKDLVWTGEDYGFLWNEGDIMFARLVCSACSDETDLDFDRVPECADNCPGQYNTLQVDTDGDGIGDTCDACPFDSDSNQTDTDGDALGDACDCQSIDANDREPAEVRRVRVGPSGVGSWLVEWDASPGADVYSVSRGDLGSLGAGSYGDCLAEGLLGLSFEDTAPVPPGTGQFFLVQAQNFDCGLGTLGWTSEETVREDTGTGSCVGQGHVDVYAQGEAIVHGVVSGSYLDTTSSDDIRQSIVEEVSSGGNPANRYGWLEHRWTLDLPPASRLEFHVEGHRTASVDGDDFTIEYSADGGTNWNPIGLPALPLVDDGIDAVASLPADLVGEVLFRVVDSDRGAGNQDLDTVFVDELFVRVVF